MSKHSLAYLGIFFLLLTILSFINIIYSYYFNLYLNVNSYTPTLIISFILSFFTLQFKNLKIKKLDMFDKIILVILGYFILPIIISLPYYFSIYNIPFINSYFEAISGFTSTGFTIFENIKHIDESLILWRSTSQWIGGLYFLFSIIFLIDIYDNNLKKSLTNFLSFNTSEIFKQLFKVFLIYSFLTLIIFLLLKLIDFRNFNAFNFALTIISSGGFKPVEQVDYLINNDLKSIIFSLTFLFSFFSIFLGYNLIFVKKKYLNFFTEDFYLLFYLVFVLLTMFLVIKEEFHIILFSLTSSVSNIGIFYSNSFSNSYFLCLILVIIGGSFFSTSSGLRFFKIFTLIKFSINELLSHSKPKQVLLSKVIFDTNKVDYNVINKYFLTILIFILSLSAISISLSIFGIGFETSIKLGILTIMNTVNSSLYGLENFNFNELNNFVKSILIIFMIIGRVEFITLMVLIKKYLFKS